MKKNFLISLTAALALLSGCGTQQARPDSAHQAYDAVGKYAAANAGALPPSAAELSAFAQKEGVALPRVVDIKDVTWQALNQKPRPAISDGALKDLVGYYVNPTTGQFGIATETAVLSNK